MSLALWVTSFCLLAKLADPDSFAFAQSVFEVGSHPNFNLTQSSPLQREFILNGLKFKKEYF